MSSKKAIPMPRPRTPAETVFIEHGSLLPAEQEATNPEEGEEHTQDVKRMAPAAELEPLVAPRSSPHIVRAPIDTTREAPPARRSAPVLTREQFYAPRESTPGEHEPWNGTPDEQLPRWSRTLMTRADGVVMKRLTITLPEELAKVLVKDCGRRRQSLGDFLAEAAINMLNRRGPT